MTHRDSTGGPNDTAPDADAASPASITRRGFTQWLGLAALGGGHPFATAERWIMAPAAADVRHAPDDLCFTPAVKLAAMLRAKQVSAREVMQAHLAQIARVMSKQYAAEVGPWRAYLSVLAR